MSILAFNFLNYEDVLFSGLLYYWVNHPEKKWLNWVLGIFFVLALLMSALGVIAAVGMLEIPA